MKKIYLLLLLTSFFGFSQSPGDIVITEIMNNPSAVGDGSGEWFEVYNTTSADIDMNGWEIKDDDTNTHIIGSSVIVPAGGYAVFGNNGDMATNGGVTVDYVYGADMALGNGTDEVVVVSGTTEIDGVRYDNGATYPDPNGASMSLDSGSLNHVDNDNGANWCEGSTAYGDGDLGTPGTANGACAPTCTAALQGHNATCDANTAGVDTYTITLDFVGGNIGTTFTVTSTSGVVGGDDPSTVASGTITVTMVDEGTDVTITVDDTMGGGICTLTRDVTSPSCLAATCANAGDVIITEIMNNTSPLSDNDGEWFEVYNTTGADIDMEGWTLTDLGSNTHTVDSANGTTIVPAGDYLVLGRSTDTMVNGGAAVDYAYGTDYTLGNGDDEIIITCLSTEIDRVEYDGGPEFPDPTGASMELSSTAYNGTDNDVGANWGEATSTYGDGTGSMGTPGAANDFVLSADQFDLNSFAMYPNPTTDGLVTITNENNAAFTVNVFNILGKQVINNAVINNNTLDVSKLTAGMYFVEITQNNASIVKKLVVK